MDPLARTQETPTIESPMIDRASQTIREKIDTAALDKTVDQTAELSLDDLGLDVDSLETTGALEQTASLEKDTECDTGHDLRDDEMTQLAPSLSSFDRTLEAPRLQTQTTRVEKFDIESTGTIYIDQVDLSGGDTVEQPRPDDIDSTASMRTRGSGLDVDLDSFGEPAGARPRHHSPAQGGSGSLLRRRVRRSHQRIPEESIWMWAKRWPATITRRPTSRSSRRNGAVRARAGHHE